MRLNLFLTCTIIFILSACDPDENQNKWTNRKLSKIAENARSETIMQNHDKQIYGTWYSSTNKSITLKFSSDSKWQYSKTSSTADNCIFLNGNNFIMHNGLFYIYKKDGETISGKYKFNNQNCVTISNFSDNKFNGTWIKK